MSRRIVDISVPLRAGIASDPPHMLPEIDYLDHHDTAGEAAGIRRYACVTFEEVFQR